MFFVFAQRELYLAFEVRYDTMLQYMFEFQRLAVSDELDSSQKIGCPVDLSQCLAVTHARDRSRLPMEVSRTVRATRLK